MPFLLVRAAEQFNSLPALLLSEDDRASRYIQIYWYDLGTGNLGTLVLWITTSAGAAVARWRRFPKTRLEAYTFKKWMTSCLTVGASAWSLERWQELHSVAWNV